MAEKFMNNDLNALSDAIPAVKRVSEKDRHKAARYVASVATDVEDARLLLAMLGLAS
ncbi:hypothetical protein GCM10028801_30340 [Nocardioides maradonensis]